MLTVQDVNEVERVEKKHEIYRLVQKVRNTEKRKIRFLGHPIKITKTTKCVCDDLECLNCGKEIDYVLISDSTSLCENDAEHCKVKFFTEDDVNLTKDHIIPSARGGTSHNFNLQTLCYHCNEDKDCNLPENVEVVTALTPNHIRRILNEVDRSDLIDLMVRLITIRKNQNHPHPEIFSEFEFLTFFPIFDNKKLDELKEKFDNWSDIRVPKDVVTF